MMLRRIISHQQLRGAVALRSLTTTTTTTTMMRRGIMKTTMPPPSTVNWNNEREVREAINLATAQAVVGVSLRDLWEFGQSKDVNMGETLRQAAQFLQVQLPLRLARCVRMLDALPFGLPQNQNVQKVRQWYVDSFRQISLVPAIKTEADVNNFSVILRQVLDRHAEVLTTMAQGIHQVKRNNELGQELHVFLDKFYTARIGIRSLISQQLALQEAQSLPEEEREEGRVGIISNCSPARVAQSAISEAQYLCDRTYGKYPEVEVLGETGIHFPYVPDHLYYMLLELLKNSCRAVIELHPDTMPPVRVIISGGEEDVTIKVSDEGGGIPRSALPLIWSYFYTTAEGAGTGETMHEKQPDHTSPVLAGYGFGLPICRLYARYWGGDATVIPMEGFGMDAYLHLSRLGNSDEPLP